MEWISVNDRLPEKCIDVIVAKQNGRVFAMTFRQERGDKCMKFHWLGEGGWYDQHSQVTHWMPLPEPPSMSQCPPSATS
jgi:hypothetical protein